MILKVFIKFCEILVALTSWQLYHVMGAQLPIGFVHRLSQIFNFLGYE